MLRIGELLECILLDESVTEKDISDAIDNHERVIINYHSEEADGKGDRVVEVYAYGTTTAGNPAIRVFQPYGDTSSKVPSWKLMRLDRITSWKPTGQKFSQPASDIYKGLGEFNKTDDKSMAVVFKVADFGNHETNDTDLKAFAAGGGPRTSGEVFKTDTERKMERLRQQLSDPITLNTGADGKTSFTAQKPSGGPQLKSPPEKKDEEEVFKTDTERDMERLMRQLDNPRKIDLSKFETGKQKDDEPNDDIETTDDKKETDKNGNAEEVFKTDTERDMERLMRQLDNPRKIDLSKIPKR